MTSHVTIAPTVGEFIAWVCQGSDRALAMTIEAKMHILAQNKSWPLEWAERNLTKKLPVWKSESINGHRWGDNYTIYSGEKFKAAIAVLDLIDTFNESHPLLRKVEEVASFEEA